MGTGFSFDGGDARSKAKRIIDQELAAKSA
jgi:hypothetical protein